MTEVDLSARTSTGDVEGEVVERSEPPGPDELAQRLAGLRGEVELRDPGRVGGQDRRRAGLQAAPARRRGRDADAALAGRLARRSPATPTASRSLDLRVGSGTYVRRDRRRARRPLPDAAAHRGRPVLASVDADDERILPPAEALPWLPAVEVSADEAAAIRGGRRTPGRTRARICDGELVAVGRVVMPA